MGYLSGRSKIFVISLVGILSIIYLQLNNDYTALLEFVNIMVIFVISFFVQLFMNREKTYKLSKVMNVFATCSIFKMLTMIIRFINVNSCKSKKIFDIPLVSSCIMIDLLSMIAIIYILRKDSCKGIKKKGIILASIVMYAGMIRLVHIIEYQFFIGAMKWLLIVGGIMIIYITFKYIGLSRHSIVETLRNLQYLPISLLTIYVVEYLIIVRYKQFCYLLRTLEMLKTLILLDHIFYERIKIPLMEREEEFNSASEEVSKQQESCNMIINMSHELKTPINVIRSALDMMILDCNIKQKQDIIGIKKDCTQVMNIIQNMLDIQKINSNYYKPSNGYYNIIKLFEDVVDSMTYQIKELNLIFDPEEEEICVCVDKYCVQNAFMLILGLLIKETERTYIKIYLEKDKEQVVIDIINKGIALFEPIFEKKEKDAVEHIDEELAVNLIVLLIKKQETGDIAFKRNSKECILQIRFKVEDIHKMSCLNETDKSVLADTMRCRYI